MENLEDLLLVCFRVFEDCVFRELFSSDGSSGWIADESGKVTDQKYHNVAQVLKVFQLANENRVADVNVRCCGVESRFDAQRLSGRLGPLQLFKQFFFPNDFNRTSPDMLELLLNRN